MAQVLWEKCLGCLQEELPAQQFNTWIRPLQLGSTEPGSSEQKENFRLLAPNRFIKDWVSDKFLERITEIFQQQLGERCGVTVESRHGSTAVKLAPKQGGESGELGVVDSSGDTATFNGTTTVTESAKFLGSEKTVTDSDLSLVRAQAGVATRLPQSRQPVAVEGSLNHQSNINQTFTFDSFVEGKSNQLALAASRQVAENPGGSYNPLFIYGGVGLGKTHLMHAVGNALRVQTPNAKIIYLHSERFVADMVKALQLNAMSDFKRFYRSVDALLIDDIQFFAKKERSQEEFFHTFNALLEGGQQMIVTCDRYPKEIDGLEERLKSRFGWGLTVAVEPPELETRAAILIKKARQAKVDLSNDAAFFIAQRIRSNVRELEGALKRVIASAHFTGSPITIDLIRNSLKDLLALQDKLVTIDNIQRVVSEYYKIKLSELLSKRRTRSIVRPRQVAMALAKELTNHSLPEIGNAFGGRDHTTVLHACRKIKELQETNRDIGEDVKHLLRTLTT